MRVVVNGVDKGHTSGSPSWHELVAMALEKDPKVSVAITHVKNTAGDEDAPKDEDFEPLRPGESRSTGNGTLHARVTFE